MFTKWEHLSNNTSKGFNSPSDQSSKSKSQISAGQMGMGRRHLVTDGIQLCCGWEGSRLPLTTAHRRIYSLVTIDDITLQEVTFESVRIGRSSVIGGWGGDVPGSSLPADIRLWTDSLQAGTLHAEQRYSAAARTTAQPRWMTRINWRNAGR